MPDILLWTVIFVGALAVLLKGADFVLESSEKIGLSLGLSPFIVGVVIVGVGTSLPELVSSLAAVFRGAPEMVVANAVGSNIANILLVGGLAAVLGGGLSVTKNLIDLDLPLLSVVTVIFFGSAWDRLIVPGEAALLLVAFGIYIGYTALHREKGAGIGALTVEPSAIARVSWRDILGLVAGCAGLVLGANYLVEAVIRLSGIMGVGTGIISLAAVALGTSLPELLVSVRAARSGRAEVALGNIFGSNVFNLLFVIGIPGMFGSLPLGEGTFVLGLPVMLAATGLFVVSGISRKIHVYEGALYIVVYAFFVGQLVAMR